MSSSLVFAIIVTASAFSAALAGLILLFLFEDWKERRAQAAAAPAREPYVFLFDDHDLIDASAAARALLRALPAGPSDWQRLLSYLAPRFPGLASAADGVPGSGGSAFLGADGSQIEITGGASLPLRLALVPGDGAEEELRIDALCLRAQEEEVESLRATLDGLPQPVWRTMPDGTVSWVNRAYVALAAHATGCLEEELSWPLPNLLDRAEPSPSEGARLICLRGTPARWFQIVTTEGEADALHTALPADALVQAEATRNEMMQTLAKTFADLPIGLAVFDRKRQLVLFNPALSDLTELRPEFLMTRPDFHTFFDRLRDTRMIPEPRDYHCWRQEIADIEKAATIGHYEDTWNLPTGATYRVTAHPHPDGALALWFTDVSADVSLTRRFRAEVQTCQEVFDHLDIAMAVFSPAGVMTLSNGAFVDLWGFDTTLATAPVDAADMIALWQTQTEPSSAWEDLARYLSELGARDPWTGQVTRLAGGVIALRAAPLGGGSTMVSFHPGAPMPIPARRDQAARPVPAL